MRVAYDMTPALVGSAGVARYVVDLGTALDRVDGVDLRRIHAPVARGSRVTRATARMRRRFDYYPRGMARAVHRQGADLVHCPGPQVPRRIDIPLVLTIHDLLPWRHPELFARRDVLRDKLQLGRAAQRASRIVVGSEYTRGEVVELLQVAPERVRVAPWGLDLRFHPVTSTPMWLARRFGIPGPYVLGTGTTDPQKNLPTLIEAFERFQLQHPEYSLVVVGGRPSAGSPIAEALNGSRARIVRAGFVTDEELVRLYGSATAFVFPSLYEGFGFPPLEAMACGAPVITSDRASLPDLVGDAAITVSATDPDLLADAIARIALSPQAADEYRQRGLQRARRYNWARCATLTAEIYREALEDPVRASDDRSA